MCQNKLKDAQIISEALASITYTQIFTQDSLYFLKCILFRTHLPEGVGSGQAVNSNDETIRVTGRDLRERSKCASESHTPA